MKHGRETTYLEDIPEDEPVLVLRGQDVCSAAAARYYAKLLGDVHADPDMIKSVLAHATEMDLWPVKKLPDLV